MVRPLILNVPFVPGQTAVSLISGLAARNFQPNMRVFCWDMGISMSDLLGGDQDTIRKVSELAGVEFSGLMESTFVKDAGASVRLNSQLMVQDQVHRSHLICCPVCVAEAMESGPLDPVLNVSGMAVWQIVPLRTCARHAVAIEVIGSSPKTNWTHDFVALVRRNLDEIRRIASEPKERKPSRFETNLLGHIAGVRGETWLDTLDFSLIAKACEVFGASIEFGPKFKPGELSSDDKWRAAQVGYDLLQGGPLALRDYLSQLQAHPALKGISGPQDAFGTIWHWLSFSRTSLDMTPISDIVREHIAETMPFGEGDLVLGQTLPRRRVHSLRTAKRKFGIMERTIRRQLESVGVIDTEDKRPNHKITFAVEPASTHLRRFKEGLNLDKAALVLNVSTRTFVSFVRQRSIDPIFSGTGKPLYHPDDIQNLLQRLAKDAPTIDIAEPPIMSIRAAANGASVAAATVVDLILKGRIKCAGVLVGKVGFEALMVDADYVKRVNEGPPKEGMSVYEFAAHFGISGLAVHDVIRALSIDVRKVIHPVTHQRVNSISFAEIERVKCEFISLRDLSVQRSLSAPHLRARLAKTGIHVIDLGEVKTFIYRREDVT